MSKACIGLTIKAINLGCLGSVAVVRRNLCCSLKSLRWQQSTKTQIFIMDEEERARVPAGMGEEEACVQF